MAALISAAIRGNLNEAMRAEVREVSAGLRRAVERTGRTVQATLRAQARAAGFRDGGRAMANTWRLATFPARPGTTTFRPASLVSSRVPALADAFDRGTEIVAKGSRYLAIPTAVNVLPARRGKARALRVTPEQMQHARGQSFVLRSKSRAGVALWCLRVSEARGLNRRGRNRLRLFVGAGTEVLTGRRKGQQAHLQSVLAQGFIPMFVLMRKVRLRKRLDIAAVHRMATSVFASALAAELRG